MEKQKSPTWSEVKKQLAKLEAKELLDIIGQLYKLNQDDKKRGMHVYFLRLSVWPAKAI